MTGYAMGETVLFHGDVYVIIGEPFQMHGGMMQRASRFGELPDGTMISRTIAVPTPEQKAADIARNQKERANQQAGFSRLKELKS